MAPVRIIALEDPGIPEFKDASELRDWAIQILQDGGDVTIRATGQRVSFRKPGIKASLKKRRIPGQKNAYKALRELIEFAEYDYSVPKDKRHEGKGGTDGIDYYRAALRMNGRLYSVRVGFDVFPGSVKERSSANGVEVDFVKYKDHEPSEIEMTPGVLNAGMSGSRTAGGSYQTDSAISYVSLGILRGIVNPSRVVGQTLL